MFSVLQVPFSVSFTVTPNQNLLFHYTIRAGITPGSYNSVFPIQLYDFSIVLSETLGIYSFIENLRTMELHYIFCMRYIRYSSSVWTIFSRVFGLFQVEYLAAYINLCGHASHPDAKQPILCMPSALLRLLPRSLFRHG